MIIGVHGSGALSAAFSPDGQEVVSTGKNGQVHIWSDFRPLVPDAPRLWRASTWCPSWSLREEILGQPEKLARAQYARCLARVAAARAPDALSPVPQKGASDR